MEIKIFLSTMCTALLFSGCSNTPGYYQQDVVLSDEASRQSVVAEIGVGKAGEWPISARIDVDHFGLESAVELRSAIGRVNNVQESYVISATHWQANLDPSGANKLIVRHKLDLRYVAANVILDPVDNQHFTLRFGGGLRLYQGDLTVSDQIQTEELALRSHSAGATVIGKYHQTSWLSYVANSSFSVALDSGFPTLDFYLGVDFSPLSWLHFGLGYFYHQGGFDNKAFEKLSYITATDECLANPDATESQWALYRETQVSICRNVDHSDKTDLKLDAITGVKAQLTFLF